jgi:hypothetical protein
MAIISLTCPGCGAPVMMPFGKHMCYCEYCGSPVQREMSDSEYSAMKKNSEFFESIRAAVHCIRNKDYNTAVDFADKASKLDETDPAPFLIKYVSYLDKDFKKASSYMTIARSMMQVKKSESLPEEEYRALLYAYVCNYLSDRDGDFKRMYITFRKVKPADIQNVRQYENLKRIGSFFSDPELKEAFMNACSDYIAESQKEVDKVQGGITQSNWDAVTDMRNNRLFLVAGTVFVDAKFVAPATQFINRYRDILNQKWEAAMKKNEVSGSKDQVNTYRYEADSLLSWMRTVR